MKQSQSPHESRDRAVQARPLARRVRIAVNLAERRICGEAAVRSPAVAEGLALAGRRACRLIDPTRTALPAGSAQRGNMDPEDPRAAEYMSLMQSGMQRTQRLQKLLDER